MATREPQQPGNESFVADRARGLNIVGLAALRTGFPHRYLHKRAQFISRVGTRPNEGHSIFQGSGVCPAETLPGTSPRLAKGEGERFR